MKKVIILSFICYLTSCSSISWVASSDIDEFTDTESCTISYGGEFSRGFVRGMGGIHYYPFIQSVEGDVIFGIHNDYNIPTGNVQIRVDRNPAITLSYTDTPIRYSASAATPDLSYLENVEGIDLELFEGTINNTMENAAKISSPYTAVAGEKAYDIIYEMVNGETLMLRTIGFGTNSTTSTTGEYKLVGLKEALNECDVPY